MAIAWSALEGFGLRDPVLEANTPYPHCPLAIQGRRGWQPRLQMPLRRPFWAALAAGVPLTHPLYAMEALGLPTDEEMVLGVGSAAVAFSAGTDLLRQRLHRFGSLFHRQREYELQQPERQQ